jgi:hypothetical protein
MSITNALVRMMFEQPSDNAVPFTVTEQHLEDALRDADGYATKGTQWWQVCLIAQACKETEFMLHGEILRYGPDQVTLPENRQVKRLIDLFDHNEFDAIREKLPITIQIEVPK